MFIYNFFSIKWFLQIICKTFRQSFELNMLLQEETKNTFGNKLDAVDCLIPVHIPSRDLAIHDT